MSVSVYCSAVNQKLFFADMLIKSFNREISAANAGALKHLQTVFSQSVAPQLQQAYYWHLADLAVGYKLQQPEFLSAKQLMSVLIKEDKSPNEVTEMVNLEDDVDSWLSVLMSANRQLSELPVIRKAEMDQDRLPIVLIQDDETTFEWDMATMRQCFKALQEMIERHREMMVEF